jgi:hypothetical protein
MTDTTYLDLTTEFKSLLRGAGFKGQITTSTGENEGEWLVKVIEPNGQTSDVALALPVDCPIEVLSVENKVNRRNTVTTYTIRTAAPALTVADEEALEEQAFDDGIEAEDELVTTGDLEVEVEDDFSAESEAALMAEVDAELEAERDDQLAAEADVVAVDETAGLDDPAGEVTQEVPDVVQATVAKANQVENAERSAVLADTTPVDKTDPAAVKAKIAELLEEKQVHSGDKKMQRDIRRRLRALGHYISRVNA